MTSAVVVEPWPTIRDACAQYQVSDDTIRRRIADGTLEARRIGPRLIRINPESLRAWGDPGGTLVPDSDRPATRNHLGTGQTESVDTIIKRAMAFVMAAQLPLSPSKTARIVRKQIKHGATTATVLGSLEYFALTYQDVTGETAVRNLENGVRA